MLNHYLIIFLIAIATQLTNAQEKSAFNDILNNNESFKYHDEWGKNNYLKLIKKFNLTPLKKGEIIFLGNSITAEGEDWKKRLDNSKVRNRGIGGDTSDGVIARSPEIIYSEPLAVFLLIGINDLYNNTIETPSVNYIADNIILIAEKIKNGSSDTKVFVQTLLPISRKKSRRNYKLYNESIRMINKIIIQNEKKNLYSVIDLYSLFVNKKGELKKELSYDGLHLNNEGYRVWSNYIKPLVDSL